MAGQLLSSMVPSLPFKYSGLGHHFPPHDSLPRLFLSIQIMSVTCFAGQMTPSGQWKEQHMLGAVSPSHPNGLSKVSSPFSMSFL